MGPWSVVSIRAGVAARLGLMRRRLFQAFSMPGYLLRPLPWSGLGQDRLLSPPSLAPHSMERN